MSTPTQAPPEIPVYAAVPPARPWFKKKRFVLPALAVVFFTMGASTGGGSATTATPTPAVTVQGPERVVTKTVTVPGPAPAAKVVTNTVDKTPRSCLKALDLADAGFTIVAEALGAAGKGFIAISDSDLAGAQAALADMTAANEKIDPDPYNAAKAECRAA